ncbi:DUF5317 family protein [Kutzneria chonburiensis]|uniref:DUF5317 family protein n=1 Tax=Kutzneria chonburiensis TaxID=1483604 RepID=A0ABV6MPB5_9PSEU|nr:DUF5317 family protein [Kutzneria chonburiensis]
MSLLVFCLPILTGLAAGYLAGGRLRHLTALRLRAWWLPWTAAAIQLAQYRLAGLRHLLQDEAHLPMLVPVFALMCLWIMLNLPRRSRPLQVSGLTVLAGAVLNGIAIAGNGRMPYSRAAAVLAGQRPGDFDSGPKNVPAVDSTHLAWLGDIIPVPPLHAVASIGDLFLLAGITLLLAFGMRPALDG